MIAFKVLFWIIISIPMLILIVGVPLLASVLYETSPQEEPDQAVQLEFDFLSLEVRETAKMR